MAMMPFCGYNMGRYFQHWLDMGRRMSLPPKIFRVNWFRKENDSYLWPGFGENLRVLLWIVDRCRSRVAAKETAYGAIPFRGDVDLNGLSIDEPAWNRLFAIDPEAWLSELDRQNEFLQQFGSALPRELLDE